MTRQSIAVGALALALGAGAAGADVVAVVSSASPVTTLSKSQIADIFLGKSMRFPDGSVAVPLDLKEGAAERDEFYLQFAGKSAAQMKAHWSKVIFTGRGQPPRTVSNGSEARKLLAAAPNAIGYLERSLVDGSVKVLLQQ
jgi:ABC-type phosphate transport system substrate-binding protein